MMPALAMSRRDARQTRRAGAAPLNLPVPRTVAGLLAWYRGDLGVTNVGGRASAWADQSGTGDANKNLVQATAGNRPTITAADANFNNQTTLALNSAHPDILIPTGNWAVAMAQPITIYSVHLVTSLAGQVAYYDDNVTPNSFSLFQTLGGGFAAEAGASLSAGDNTLNKPTVFAVVFNGVSSSCYDNARTAVASGNAGANGSVGLLVGDHATGGGSPLAGTIAEIIVYSGAHNATTRSTVLTYLGARYAIAIGA